MKDLRYLQHDIQELCFDSKKMAFVSGPRQVGKTTFAKAWLNKRRAGEYYNWDETTFRRLWTKDPTQVVADLATHPTPLLVLDEIHKSKLWKRSLKGLYDTLSTDCDILVTGSAKLNVYRRGSDSLLGRYHNFRLHPFSVAELMRRKLLTDIEPTDFLTPLFTASHSNSRLAREWLEHLDRFGGFPEPLQAQSVRKLQLWQQGRVERLIREDLRDLSRIPELSQVEMLTSLLPERVASPFSLTSLAEDLGVSPNTVKHWTGYLKELFYCYEIKPYASSLPRSIKKEGKLYLWDWSEVENDGARFENLIASHLLKYTHYLRDTGYGKYELHYVRNKEKKEIDFLITQKNKPWLPIEVKLNDDKPSSNWPIFMPYLACQHAIQVIKKPGVFRIHDYPNYQLLVVSADIFLRYLI